jgi:hypothetical protein
MRGGWAEVAALGVVPTLFWGAAACCLSTRIQKKAKVERA